MDSVDLILTSQFLLFRLKRDKPIKISLAFIALYISVSTSAE